MALYFYKGPVMAFGRCIERNWTGQTYATTDKKAISNLAYQYKKLSGNLPTAKIELPGVLVKGGE